MQTEIVSVNQLPPSLEVLIYGTGAAGHKLFLELSSKRKDIVVHAFIDSFKGGESIYSKPVINVKDLNRSLKGGTVVVASIFSQEIAKILSDLKIHDYYLYNDYSVDDDYYKKVFHLSQSVKDKRISLVKSIHDFQNWDDSFVIVNAPVSTTLDIFFEECLSSLTSQKIECEKTDVSLPDASDVIAKIKDHKPSRVVVVDWCGDQYNLCSFLYNLDQSVGQPISVMKIPCKFKSAVVVDQLKIIYLPIKKSASSSTIALLRSMFEDEYNIDNSPHRVQTGKSLLRTIDITDRKYNDYRFFTVGRYPYLRLASLYASSSRKMNHMMPSLKEAFGEICFDRFVEFIANCGDPIAEGHFASQVESLRMPDGTIKDCDIIKLENYDNELFDLFQSYGVQCKPMHLNKTKKNNQDYLREYYNRCSIDLVNERYREDFHALDYPVI